MLSNVIHPICLLMIFEYTFEPVLLLPTFKSGVFEERLRLFSRDEK